MPHTSALLGFALVSFGLVLTPGPNMIYLISRSITQGPAAGIVSLGGGALGFARRLYILARVEEGEAWRTLSLSGEEKRDRQPAHILRDGGLVQPAQSE